MSNLELWKKVEKTNPEYTKKANVAGNHITSIAPQFQILNATEQFGVYGVTWGFRNIEIDYTLKDIGMVVFKATFYFPKGAFEIINSVKLYKDGAKTKIDDDFAKKVETDTLTKALSKLGFNADIFLGRFDDTKYVEEMKQEFNKPQLITSEQVLQLEQLITDSEADKAKFLATFKIAKLDDMIVENYQTAVTALNNKLNKKGK
jgi:hypothetical protein